EACPLFPTLSPSAGEGGKHAGAQAYNLIPSRRVFPPPPFPESIMAPDTLERSLPELKDPPLWRERFYIDGKWHDADGGATRVVNNPATGKRIGTSPRMGAAEAESASGTARAAVAP